MMIFAAKLCIFMCFSCLLVTRVNAVCLAVDEYEFNSNCYHVYDGSFTFDDASKMCMQNGYVMASIISSEEHTFLVDLLNTKYTGEMYYVGATDAATEDVWLWQNGDPWLTDVMWSGGTVPASDQARDCGVLYKSKLSTMYALVCTTLAGVICQSEYILIPRVNGKPTLHITACDMMRVCVVI
ncbi:perlucin-like protein [Saccoglossus kowalevskii]